MRSIGFSGFVAGALLVLGFLAYSAAFYSYMESCGFGWGPAGYRSLLLFVGSKTECGRDSTWLDWAGGVAVAVALLASVLAIAKIVRLVDDRKMADVLRRHAVIIGDRPELNELAQHIVEWTLPNKYGAQAERDDLKELRRSWPTGFGKSLVWVGADTAAVKRLKLRAVDGTHVFAASRALKGASRVLVARADIGDTLRAVSWVSMAELAPGAIVHVAVEDPAHINLVEDAASQKSNGVNPPSIDVFVIRGRAVSAMVFRFRLEGCPVVIAAPERDDLVRDIEARLAGTTDRVLWSSGPKRARSWLTHPAQRAALERAHGRVYVLVVGWPDADAADMEARFVKQLARVNFEAGQRSVAAHPVASRLTQADLRSPDAPGVFSVERVLRDPLVLALRPQVRLAQELMKLVGRDPEAGIEPADLAIVDDIRRYLENWFVEPCDHQRSRVPRPDHPGTETADRFVAIKLEELRQTGGAASDAAAPTMPVPASAILHTLRLAGEFTCPRSPDTRSLDQLLSERTLAAWSYSLAYDTEGRSFEVAPEGVSGPAELKQFVCDAVAALCGKWSMVDGWPLPTETGRTASPSWCELGVSLPRWLNVRALARSATELAATAPAGLDSEAAFLVSASILACAPPLLAQRGLAFSSPGHTWSERQVWLGARQVHDEYELAFEDIRDRRALTSADWNASLPYFRSSNHDAAIRSISYAAALSRHQRRLDVDSVGRDLPFKKGRSDLDEYLGTISEPVLRLARFEHYQWLLEKCRAGALRGERNDHLGIHPLLLPWDADPKDPGFGGRSLDALAKAKNVNIIATCARVTDRMSRGS